MSVSDTRIRNKYGFENPFKADPLIKRAMPFLKNKKHLLDVGCGEGADSVFFVTKGFQVTSIDHNKIYLRRLRALASDNGFRNLSLNYANVLDYPYRQNFYDVINCLLVGCCMKRSEFDRLIISLKPAIKRSGIIIMSLRNYLDSEYIEYASTEIMIEPNTFQKREECCKINYFIEKNRLRKLFSAFEILYYYEGYAPDKYKEAQEHGDSYIICRKR